jgi:uncharacterized protein
MDILTSSEINRLVEQSELVYKYNSEINRESAYEILTCKIKIAHQIENQEKLNEGKKKSQNPPSRSKSVVESISENTMVRQLGRTVLRELTRGLLGALGIKK